MFRLFIVDLASRGPFNTRFPIMAAFVATYPPLGQVTSLQNSAVTVHAVLEVPLELAEAPWQLALWHTDGSQAEWTETQLLPSPPDARPMDLHQANAALSRLYFKAELVVRASLNFTVKYRQGTDESEWLWTRNEQGSDDAVVVVDQKPTRDSDAEDLPGESEWLWVRNGNSEDLPDLIHDLNPDVKWKAHLSQTPGTRLWSIEAAVDGAKGEKSSYADVPLGIPWGSYLRYGSRTETRWQALFSPFHWRV